MLARVAFQSDRGVLADAAGAGDVVEVTRLLGEGHDVNGTGVGPSPLAAATRGQHVAVMRVLERHGVSIPVDFQVDVDGANALRARVNEAAVDRALLGFIDPAETVTLCRSLLHIAIETREARAIDMLEYGLVDVNAEHQGMSAVMRAVRAEADDKLIVAMLRHGAEPWLTDLGENALLHFALLHKPTGVVKTMIADPGVDVSRMAASGVSPLFLASLPGRRYHPSRREIVALLQQRDADEMPYMCELVNLVERDDKFNKKARREPLLFTALRLEDGMAAEVVQHILFRGADPTLTNSNGETALHAALRKENLATAKALLEDPRTDVNARDSNDSTPMMAAVEAGMHAELILAMLRRKGADRKLKNCKGDTCLHIALRNCSWGAARTLIDGERLESYAPNVSQQTPLMLAIDGRAADELIFYMLTNGADSRQRNRFRQIPLHIALQRGKWDVAKALIADMANTLVDDATAADRRFEDINARDTTQQTPLLEAIEAGAAAELIEFMLKQGADPTVNNRLHHTALHVALMNSDWKAAEVLLTDSFVDVDMPDGCKQTPLQIMESTTGAPKELLAVIQQRSRVSEHESSDVGVRRSVG